MLTFIYTIWDFLSGIFSKRKYSGEFIANGESEISIYHSTSSSYPDPSDIFVAFCDDNMIPCDPGSDDKLEICIRFECKEKCRKHAHKHYDRPFVGCNHQHSWFLQIEWKVSSPRKIVWEFYY